MTDEVAFQLSFAIRDLEAAYTAFSVSFVRDQDAPTRDYATTVRTYTDLESIGAQVQSVYMLYMRLVGRGQQGDDTWRRLLSEGSAATEAIGYVHSEELWAARICRAATLREGGLESRGRSDGVRRVYGIGHRACAKREVSHTKKIDPSLGKHTLMSPLVETHFQCRTPENGGGPGACESR